MVRTVYIYSLIAVLSLLVLKGVAQSHLFSELSLNKTSVFKGEPVEVRVSVFTSTWFTKGVDPGNIKVDGAFTVYFRSVSETKRINGKTYAGVNMIFNVFPYENNDIVFPAVTFQVETPDEGGYKGIQRTVSSKTKTIKVKPVPQGFDVSQWLVTQNVSLDQNWSGNLNNIKVGDIIEREIIRTVAGNVSGLIPALVWGTINGVSTYIGRSEVNDNRTRTSISADRTDRITYLFEREGELVIPAMEISWWNPVQNRAYKRTLEEIKINVQPNPNLEMLESIKDSLNIAKQISGTEESEKESLSILGLSLKQFIAVSIGSIVLIIILIWSLVKLVQFLKKRKEAYRSSEKFFFRQIFKVNPNESVLNKIYYWLDHIKIPEPTIQYFNDQFGNPELAEDIIQLDRSKPAPIKLNKKAWENARKNYLLRQSGKMDIHKTNWINPS